MVIYKDYADSCMRCKHADNDANKQPCKICARNGSNSNDLNLNYYEVPEGIVHISVTDSELELLRGVESITLEMQ